MTLVVRLHRLRRRGRRGLGPARLPRSPPDDEHPPLRGALDGDKGSTEVEVDERVRILDDLLRQQDEGRATRPPLLLLPLPSPLDEHDDPTSFPGEDGGRHIPVFENFLLEVSRGEQVEELEPRNGQGNSGNAEEGAPSEGFESIGKGHNGHNVSHYGIPGGTWRLQSAGKLITGAPGGDSTWATPLLFPAIGHGIDMSVQALTKYVAGHSDVMMGAVTATAAHYPKLRSASYRLGYCVGPDDAFLTLRGLRTLGVRLAQQGKSALKIAHWLAAHPAVERVLHPALPGCPGHDLWARDFNGASGLFGFVLKQGKRSHTAALIDDLDHFGIGFSWGGFESLILPSNVAPIRTATQFNAPGPLLRLSIGLEDPDDLIADLAAGLERYQAQF